MLKKSIAVLAALAGLTAASSSAGAAKPKRRRAPQVDNRSSSATKKGPGRKHQRGEHKVDASGFDEDGLQHYVPGSKLQRKAYKKTLTKRV